MLHMWQIRVPWHQVRRLASQGCTMGVRAVPQFQAIAGPHLLVGGGTNVLQPTEACLPAACTQ